MRPKSVEKFKKAIHLLAAGATAKAAAKAAGCKVDSLRKWKAEAPDLYRAEMDAASSDALRNIDNVGLASVGRLQGIATDKSLPVGERRKADADLAGIWARIALQRQGAELKRGEDGEEQARYSIELVEVTAEQQRADGREALRMKAKTAGHDPICPECGVNVSDESKLSLPGARQGGR